MTKTEQLNLIMLAISWSNIGLTEVIDVLEKTPLHKQGVKHHTRGLKQALENQSKQVYEAMKGDERAELEMYVFDNLIEQFVEAVKNINMEKRDYNTLTSLLKCFNEGEGIKTVSEEEYQRLTA